MRVPTQYYLANRKHVFYVRMWIHFHDQGRYDFIAYGEALH